MKDSILTLLFLLTTFCGVTSAAETNTYLFQPDQSIVIQTGGVAGIYEIHSIKGRFCLKVDFESGSASFDWVNATLSDSPFLYTQSLEVLFKMTELVGTVTSETTIDFEGTTSNGTDTQIHIRLYIEGDSVPLIGGTAPPCCDFFVFDLSAVAVEFSNTYYVDAANGDDNNDGLSPNTAFATIQKGVDIAGNGDTVIVSPGLYPEIINFLGKNITLTTTDPTSSGIVKNTTIVGMVVFRGTEGTNCTLTGFNIDGYINGFDWEIDPNGSNHTQAAISHCVLENFATGCGRLIYACDGTISNCTIANIGYVCLRPWPVPAIVGCHGLIKNSTMANMLDGIEVLEGGTCTITNCIIYYDTWAFVPTGATLNISYCNFEGGRDRIFGNGAVYWGTGNIDTDPCFARLMDWQTEGDYHLKSQAGRWTSASSVEPDANEGRWTIDDVTSLCIDAGDPMSPVGLEPFPNGGIINMGAYGGNVA